LPARRHQHQLRHLDGGDFFATAYAASKGAINTFTKYVATQYGAQGIRWQRTSYWG